MKKSVYVLFLLFLASEFCCSQVDSLVIFLKNGVSETFAITDIRKISFENLSGICQTKSENSVLIVRDNYPNPCDESTEIEFELLSEGFVQIEIFNEQGIKIKTINCPDCHPGINAVTWDCKLQNNNKVPNGVYYYVVQFADKIISKKLLIIGDIK